MALRKIGNTISKNTQSFILKQFNLVSFMPEMDKWFLRVHIKDNRLSDLERRVATGAYLPPKYEKELAYLRQLSLKCDPNDEQTKQEQFILSTISVGVTQMWFTLAPIQISCVFLFVITFGRYIQHMIRKTEYNQKIGDFTDFADNHIKMK